MLTFRPAENADLEALYQFNQALIEQYEDLSAIDLPAVLSWIRRKLKAKLPEYRAVFRESKKIGYFRLCEADDGSLEIDDLYIFSEYRSQGIGTEILRYCISESERLSKPLLLYVFLANTRAAALYERMGFTLKEVVSPTRAIYQRMP